MWIVIPGVIPNVLISTAPSGLARMRSGRKTPPNGYGSNGFRPSPRARLNVAGAAVAERLAPDRVELLVVQGTGRERVVERALLHLERDGSDAREIPDHGVALLVERDRARAEHPGIDRTGRIVAQLREHEIVLTHDGSGIVIDVHVIIRELTQRRDRERHALDA